MNLIEAVELLNAISDFHFKDPKKRPTISIHDKEKDGFVLFVKAHLIPKAFRDHIKRNAESRNLRMRESEGYLIIHR